MAKETLIYQGNSKWSRNAYIKFVGDKIVFDCSDGEYGPIEFDIQTFYEAELKHAHDIPNEVDDLEGKAEIGEAETYWLTDEDVSNFSTNTYMDEWENQNKSRILTHMSKEDACNWTLVREKDGLAKQSEDIAWIEWDESGTVKARHKEIAVGRSLIMSPFNQYFTWQTTQITEILEEKEHYIKFKTLNSTYELFKLV
jgi:hypothetical protein